MGQSLWLRECHGVDAGAPPPVDLAEEKLRGEDVRWFINMGKANAVHDVSDGGLIVALSEMALAGGLGVILDTVTTTAEAFGEDQGRYILAASPEEFLENAIQIGTVGGDAVLGITLTDLRATHEGFFPKLMGADAALA